MIVKKSRTYLGCQSGLAPQGLLAILSVTLLLNTGCTSLRDYRLSVGAGAFAVGATAGASAAGPDEVPETQAALWGSIFATSALVLSEFFWSDSYSHKQAQLENLKLSQELNKALQPPRRQFQEVFRYDKPTVLGNPPLQLRLPAKTQVLVFKTDEWIFEGTEKLYHQNLLYEFHPPQ